MIDRKTIGFIIPNIFYSNENKIWTALTQAARSRNINLVSIIGARLNPKDVSGANAIYRLIKPQEIDGILIWSALMRWDVTLEEFCTFVSGLCVPVVSVDDVLPGVPSVVVSNYSGICTVMEHMIKVHGRKRIAFFRGPENSAIAELRFRAYKDTLAVSRIELDPTLITPAESWMDTESIIRFIEKKADSIDCIVSSSDYKAFVALEELHRLGLRVPEDVAVAGFDNDPKGRELSRPLTTLEPDYIGAFVCGLDILLDVIKGGIQQAETVVPARLVIRESCGCLSAYVSGARRLRGSGENRRRTPRTGGVEEERQLREAFTRALSSPETEAAFIHKLEDIVEVSVESIEDQEVWQQRIYDLQADHPLGCLRFWKAGACEDLIRQAQVVVSLAAARKMAFRNLDREHFRNDFLDVCQSLISTYDLEEIYTKCAEGFRRLGIRSFCIRLYIDANDLVQGSQIAMFSTGGETKFAHDNTRSSATDGLIPDEFFGLTEGFRLVAMPLYFQEDQIGLVLFGDGPDDGEIYELLRGQLSSAFKGALLVGQLKKHEKQLQLYSDKLKKSNEELEQFAFVASHDLQEPLRKILFFGEKLKTNHSDILDEKGLDYIKRMNNAAVRMSNFIKDLLRYARATTKAKPFEKVDLNEIIKGVVSDLEIRIHEAKAEIRTENLPVIEAESLQIRQLFQNIIGNAIKYRRVNVPSVIIINARIANSEDRAWCEIDITDNGIGFDNKYANQIFGLFQRLQGKSESEGTGIGLAVCKKIVEQHGGAISARSREGEGSIFHIRLPLTQKITA